MRHEVQSLKQLHRPLDHAPPAAVRGVVSFAGMMEGALRCACALFWLPKMVGAVVSFRCLYSVALHAFVVWLADQVIKKDPASRGTEKSAHTVLVCVHCAAAGLVWLCLVALCVQLNSCNQCGQALFS